VQDRVPARHRPRQRRDLRVRQEAVQLNNLVAVQSIQSQSSSLTL
jgi:hypothetical protein